MHIKLISQQEKPIPSRPSITQNHTNSLLTPATFTIFDTSICNLSSNTNILNIIPHQRVTLILDIRIHSHPGRPCTYALNHIKQL